MKIISVQKDQRAKEHEDLQKIKKEDLPSFLEEHEQLKDVASLHLVEEAALCLEPSSSEVVLISFNNAALCIVVD
jgi:hypothetical protein